MRRYRCLTSAPMGHMGEAEHEHGVWLNVPCKELVLFSDQYDFTISLLHFGDAVERSELDEEPEEDIVDRMINRTPGDSWLG